MSLHRWRPHSIRVRFALAFGLLLVLAMLNIGAFYWGARQRDRVFSELGEAIGRHGTLTEVKAELDDHYKRIRVVSDLIGVDQVSVGEEEKTRIVDSIEDIHERLAQLEQGSPTDPGIAGLERKTGLLVTSWKTFYERQDDDPAKSIAEVVLTAEPLAQELISVDLPRSIRAQSQQVERARTAFVRTDRTSSRLVWAILIASGVLSGALAYSLSRDLLRAIAALKGGADRFGAGELGHRVEVENCAELEEVGVGLNTMAGRLRQMHTELQERNEELADLAFRDPLTGLSNRALFRQRVERTLADRDTDPETVVVLFLDLDDFKRVNDTMGHAAGDRLLTAVGESIVEAMPSSATVARLGGDEFAILLHSEPDLTGAVAAARRIIASVHAPLPLDGKPVRVGTSIGIARGRGGITADELLRDPDVAMYRAKAAGKGGYEIFAPEMHAALLDKLEMETELRGAVEAGQLSLLYQPIVDLASGHITGFEALARWHHPRRGLVLPTVFVPLAEDTGIILPIGHWVMREACREAARWQRFAPRGTPITVSVNVSGHQLEHPSFVADVKEALVRCGLDPQCLVLEITESVVMRDSAVSLERLRELKALGVKLAIDDFGTGYSSLAYLQRFPVDILKIDKTFVDPITRGGNDAALARTIITLCETLRLSAVAEGIEYEEQHTQLCILGCHLGQGYLFSPPVTAEEAYGFLRLSDRVPHTVPGGSIVRQEEPVSGR